MGTRQKKRDISTKLHAQGGQGKISLEPCTCVPPFTLSAQHKDHVTRRSAEASDDEEIVPVSPSLLHTLHEKLNQHFPRIGSLSLLLLHVSQLEPAPIAQPTTLLYKRRRHHVPVSILEQILVNVRRVIRADDNLLVQYEAGVAIIFPDVDRQGAYKILERIFHSVSLLQAETIVPPLTRETSILLGTGSYPEPGTSIEQLLYHSGQVAQKIVLRPALISQQWNTPSLTVPDSPSQLPRPADGSHPTAKTPLHISTKQRSPAKEATGTKPTHNTPTSPSDAIHRDDATNRHDAIHRVATHAAHAPIPYMSLPRELSPRLKQLLPYAVAQQLRCAPVGKDHHSLTVAMADPSNNDNVLYLQQITGMTIFPVACEEDDLNTLLEKKW